jgi:PKD repeat protein
MMKKTRLQGAVYGCLLSLSLSANAVIQNTLGGVDYEWLEFSVTQGLSRVQVEAMIAAAMPGDTLYGYEYATRAQTEALLLSYAPWDGLDGYHNESVVIAGVESFINDFGATYTYTYPFLYTQPLTGGGTVTFNYTEQAWFHYGADLECSSDMSLGCLGDISWQSLDDGPVLSALQLTGYGWNATGLGYTNPKTETSGRASLLVRTSAALLPPVANPNGPYNGTVGQQVAFDGSNSFDPDGSIISYDWNFGDGNTGTGVSPTHTYAAEGYYDVSLTVMDNDGLTNTAATSASIAAVPQDPIADPNGPYNGFEGVTLTLDGSASTDPDGGVITQYDWDFGDGNLVSVTTPTVQHTYAATGSYNVSLMVVDDEGAQSVPAITTASINPLADVFLTWLQIPRNVVIHANSRRLKLHEIRVHGDGDTITQDATVKLNATTSNPKIGASGSTNITETVAPDIKDTLFVFSRVTFTCEAGRSDPPILLGTIYWTATITAEQNRDTTNDVLIGTTNVICRN